MKKVISFLGYGTILMVASYLALKNTNHPQTWINIIPMYVATYGIVEIIKSQKIHNIFVKTLLIILLLICIFIFILIFIN